MKRATCCLLSKDFSAPPDQDFCTGFWFYFDYSRYIPTLIIYNHHSLWANLPLSRTGRVHWHCRTSEPCWVSSKGHSVRTFTRNPCGEMIWNRLDDLESPSQNQVHKTVVSGNPTQSLRRRSSKGSWVQRLALYLSVPVRGFCRMSSCLTHTTHSQRGRLSQC